MITESQTCNNVSRMMGKTAQNHPIPTTKKREKQKLVLNVQKMRTVREICKKIDVFVTKLLEHKSF